ncbi:unnamed protein product, partial [Ectocarpus sp. 12 AP-2014]
IDRVSQLTNESVCVFRRACLHQRSFAAPVRSVPPFCYAKRVSPACVGIGSCSSVCSCCRFQRGLGRGVVGFVETVSCEAPTAAVAVLAEVLVPFWVDAPLRLVVVPVLVVPYLVPVVCGASRLPIGQVSSMCGP